jgi:hypothetical protein
MAAADCCFGSLPMIRCIMDNWETWGIATGAFWGIFAFFIYVPWPLPRWSWNVPKFVIVGRWFIVPFGQILFNFIGGFAGWYLLSMFYERYSRCHFGWPELVLLFLSLVGISGKLSELIWKIPDVFTDIVARLIKK